MPAASADRTLLVVEDNDVAREAVAVVLRRVGYHIVPATNGEEALRLLWGGPRVDLVLLDMLLPVLDGWHVLGRLLQEPTRPPVVLTTGADVLGGEWAEAHGCAGFLRKPFETEELLDQVRRCLG
jgi:CheY-like chemotaxis protein